ncbi:MAG TPA: type II toxin-antitoxin system PemK/MazF family toxin [Terracidiphilus sp.]|jgi:mRNA interferase MazF|nr:type II toxin-antitoxin system PemK/MazF family toxin [Terracidiphilus sp.]
MPIERSEVYWINFDPSLGGEIQKTRPAIVLSNNAANLALNRVQVVPITSRTDRVYPGEAIIELKGAKRKAMADQLTTVSKQRLGNKLGALSSQDMTRVEAAIAVQLALNLK